MDFVSRGWHRSLAQKGQTSEPYLEACGARQPLSVRFSARILKRASFSPSLNLSAKPESAAPHHRAHVARAMPCSPQQLWSAPW